jgi:cysteinyl-tRNA synthetase
VELYDTLTATKQPLEPRDPGRVGIYACGPTVYGRIHVGNARPYVVFMLLKRFLERSGMAVTLVCNITDINDKIYEAANAAEKDSAALASEMTAHYLADTERLGLGRPDHEPLASESIEAIVAYIEALIERGHAYQAGGDVYFRVRSDPAYGTLSRRAVDDELDQGEGLEGAELKEDPADFALWKAHKPQEDTSWESPWGPGRPGWHIECSAMAESALGLGFDIHGGGLDLLFPHHENEAAQTRSARGAELARLWVHNGMLQAFGEKMAKSVGNIAPLHEILDAFGRDAVIMYLCGAHYRQPMAFGDEPLRQAQASVARVRDAAVAPGDSPPDLRPLRERFLAALSDDFNTPEALAAMFEWIREANRREGPVGDADLRAMLDVLGLENLLDGAPQAPGELVALAERRAAARAAGDFERADELRAEIARSGWEVRDVPAGFELSPL